MILSFIIIFIIFFLGLLSEYWHDEFEIGVIFLMILISFIVAWIFVSIWVGSPILFKIFKELI